MTEKQVPKQLLPELRENGRAEQVAATHRSKGGQEGKTAMGQAGMRSDPATEEGGETAPGRHCTGRERGSSVLEQETGWEFRDSCLNQIQGTGAARRNKMEVGASWGRDPQ